MPAANIATTIKPKLNQPKANNKDNIMIVMQQPACLPACHSTAAVGASAASQRS